MGVKPPHLPESEFLSTLDSLVERLDSLRSGHSRLKAPQGATLSPDLAWIVKLARSGNAYKVKHVATTGDLLLAVSLPDTVQRGGGSKKGFYKAILIKLNTEFKDRWACLRNLFAAVSGSHIMPATLRGYDIAFIPATVDTSGRIVLETWVNDKCTNNGGDTDAPCEDCDLDPCARELCRQYLIAWKIWSLNPPRGAGNPLEYINFRNKLTAQSQDRYYVAYVESQVLRAPLRAVVLAGSKAERRVTLNYEDPTGGESVHLDLPPTYDIDSIGSLAGLVLRHTVHYIPSTSPEEAFYYLGLLLSRWIVSMLQDEVKQAGKQIHLTSKPAKVIEEHGAIYEGLEWQAKVAVVAGKIQKLLSSESYQHYRPRSLQRVITANRTVSQLFGELNSLVGYKLA